MYLPVWQSLIVCLLLWLLYRVGLFGFGSASFPGDGLFFVIFVVVFALALRHCVGFLAI